MGSGLHPLGLDRAVHNLGDALDDPGGFVGALRLLRGGSAESAREDSVDEEKRKFPPQAVAGPGLGKVEGHSPAQRPVQLRSQGVEDEVHLVQDQDARGLE